MLEARDASGEVHQAEFEVMTLPGYAYTISGIVGAIALFGAVMSIRWGGWGGWTLGIIAALVALAGLGMLAFLMYGHYAGFPWHFA